ncbi:pre-mRNA processing factor 3-domain-containing protein [Scheffersomyces xylosifermentans]|uniref:pre-mRNA processing factor 3-domain-containing protein n=1 Tax=Scheffersomyces xylosifermentans TaxID=1304137 RepID=UPI00315CE612
MSREPARQDNNLFSRKRKNTNESSNGGHINNINHGIAPQKRTLTKEDRITRTQQTDGQQRTTSKPLEEGKGGLNVEIHPLLRTNVATPALPKNHNPLNQKVRKWFDPTAINPYLNQSSSALSSSHKPRPLQFNPRGKYISQGNALREKLKAEDEERKKLEETKAKGLTADENLGEHLYKPEYPPLVEWWDKPYLKDRDYGKIDDETRLVLDNEDQPVSIYIQHPVLISAPWEKLETEAKPMYLTKKELKRIRRNERQEKHKDKQDRIKLGLDPPPPPKVKLSNLMNVLTNEAIKDPTAVEMRVREEVDARLQKHLEENEARKLTKEQKHAKIQEQHEKDLQKGLFTLVFKIDKLSNPQHFYKIDVNAKQLDLVGICLRNPKFNLIVVEGGPKSIKFYKKLLLNRIKWTENAAPKSKEDNTTVDEDLEDLSSNKCSLVWEGQVKDLKFQKWSIMNSRDDDEAYDVLQRFGIENYWREATVFEE